MHKLSKLNEFFSSFTHIIFDFDGVIADSEPFHINSLYEAFINHHINIDKKILFESVGMDDGDIFKLLEDSISISKSSKSKILQEKKLIIKKRYSSGKILPILNAINFIKICSMSHTLAIATNSPSDEVNLFCKYYGIYKYFKTIVCGNEMYPPKPDPEIYRQTIQNLFPNINENGSSKFVNSCVAIEDSISGLKAARACGLTTIALTSNSNKLDYSNYSDLIINSFNELITI